MIEKLLFEIPIYLMSKDDFIKKERKYKEKNPISYDESSNTKNQIEAIEHFLNYPYNLWLYNQIIGYIQILSTNEDILFNIYLTTDKQIHYRSTRKHFIEPLRKSGLHLRRNKSDDINLKQRIIDYVDALEKNELKKYYINDALFKKRKRQIISV